MKDHGRPESLAVVEVKLPGRSWLTADPFVSVIIPTHNRRARLGEVIEALNCQSYSLSNIEVVVIANGCEDDTVPFLSSHDGALQLRIIRAPQLAPGVARNIGARYARGTLFVFIDDDVVPCTMFVAAHAHAHYDGRMKLVLGPYPPVDDRHEDSPFRKFYFDWWNNKFERLRIPGHRFTYDDVLSGNMSIEATLFHRIGGFLALEAHEDYEFALRAFQSKVPVFFAPEALAYHYEYETNTILKTFSRAVAEGKADIFIGHAYPEVRQQLLITQWVKCSSRIKMWTAFTVLKLAPSSAVGGVLRASMQVLHARFFRRVQMKVYHTLRFYQ
jgi:glycosyltransferase involved in cell wall biosynthesis